MIVFSLHNAVLCVLCVLSRNTSACTVCTECELLLRVSVGKLLLPGESDLRPQCLLIGCSLWAGLVGLLGGGAKRMDRGCLSEISCYNRVCVSLAPRDVCRALQQLFSSQRGRLLLAHCQLCVAVTSLPWRLHSWCYIEIVVGVVTVFKSSGSQFSSSAS